jgi:hypothetical protein
VVVLACGGGGIDMATLRAFRKQLGMTDHNRLADL